MNDELLNDQPKQKPDKTLIIVGITAVILVLVAGITYLLTRPKAVQPQKTAALTMCPEANKQHPGHCISSNIGQLNLKPNTAGNYQFAILDDKGKPIKDFEKVHEKQMHVMVVRKDLAYFQHIHPTFNANTGVWTLDKLTIPTDGPYRLFADFTEGGTKSAVTIYEDFNVGDMTNYQKQPVGDTNEDKTFGKYQVLLQTEPIVLQANTAAKLVYLFGDAQNGGASLTGLQPYLGAMGHAVILSENLDFIHAHATDNKLLASRGVVEFMATLPKEGKYKVFGQFQHNGNVFTTDFVLPVYANLSPADQRINSGDDVHSGH
jgi:hypothetical protein